MRRLAILATVAFAVTFGAPSIVPEAGLGTAMAQSSSSCGFIQNADRRNLCRARAENQASHCGFIQNADLRNLCKAVVSGDRSSCGFIKDADMRNECKANF
jgi:ribosomal protein L37E